MGFLIQLFARPRPCDIARFPSTFAAVDMIGGSRGTESGTGARTRAVRSGAYTPMKSILPSGTPLWRRML
jgi:hypothetical protein